MFEFNSDIIELNVSRILYCGKDKIDKMIFFFDRVLLNILQFCQLFSVENKPRNVYEKMLIEK